MVEYSGKKYLWPLNRDDFNFFYNEEKLSAEKIGHIFSINGASVSYWREKYRIPKLEAWQRLKVPSSISSQEKEVVLGHLLGDGYIGKNSKQAHLRVSQSSKQIDFVNQLYELLIQWAAYPPVLDIKTDNRHNKQYFTHRFDTVAHPVFTNMKDLCYPNGKKKVSLEWLEQIGPLGIAVWYQGDGSLKGIMPTLSTEGFGIEDQLILSEWLKNDFSIDARIRKKGKYTNLVIDNGDYFKDLIGPFVIDFFKYKLPEQRRRKLKRKKQHYGLL